MWRSSRMAGMVLALAMASGGVALAQGGYQYYDRGDYGYSRENTRIARDFGYDDGSRVAREDFARRKPYDPYPRGKYAHADRGYRREFGDKYAYQDQYARGYQAGYRRAFGRY